MAGKSGVHSGGVGGRGRPSGVATAESDPWHFWVFSIDGNAFLYGESSTKESHYSGSLRANRTTPAWRMGVGLSYSRVEDRYQLSTGTATSLRNDWGMSSYLVRSVGAQWALGIQGTAGSSTYYNQSFDWALEPGIEYDFFPYKESSRRSLRLEYLIGPKHFDYKRRTIYGYLHETRAQQSLTARLALVQPWGSWSTSLIGANYAADASKYHATLRANLNVRLFEGFSINAFAYYEWVHDQTYIPAEGVTDEEILLRERQLSTVFQYDTSIGIQYKFGSIFNNVVNPRFGSVNSGGGVSGQ